MTVAAFELQMAVRTVLAADTRLVDLLGGSRIYDSVPAKTTAPYVTFGPSTNRDWGTSTERGSEHLFELHTWSEAAGAKETHLILDAISEALEGAALAPAGQHTVNLVRLDHSVSRDADGKTYRGTLRLRAVLEPTS